jgi:beta-glucosidase
MPEGHPREAIETVLDGLRAVAPTGWDVGYARGADIVEPTSEPDVELLPDGQPAPAVAVPAAADATLIDEAVRLAEAADHAVVVVGDDILLTGEGRSTATLELMGGQVALLDAVVATGTPTTVVVISGKPLVLPDSALRADALIQAFSPGMQGGRAIAELLLGQIEPSGRLPISVPRHAGQLPVFYNTVRGQHGDRYADLTQEPRFAFGEGLSYTEVTYSDLRVHTPAVAPHEDISASIRLSNVGSRPALETVQVYVRDVVTSATWADRELKSFVQVHLQPGATQEVALSVPATACSIVTADGRRTVEPGDFELLVGRSSRPPDLLVARFTIQGLDPSSVSS